MAGSGVFKRSVVHRDSSTAAVMAAREMARERQQYELLTGERHQDARGAPRAEERRSGGSPQEDEVPELSKLLATLDAEEDDVVSDDEEPVLALDGVWRNSEGDQCTVAGGMCVFGSGRSRPVTRHGETFALHGWVATEVGPDRVEWEKKGSRMRWDRASRGDEHAEEPAGGEVGADLTPGYAELMAQLSVEEKREEPRQGKQASAGEEGDGMLVSVITLSVRGSGCPECNCVFKFDANHKGKPLYKSSKGAIVYFNEYWKMNSAYKTTSWRYCVRDAKGPLPPEGRWAAEGSKDGGEGDRPPALVIVGRRVRVLEIKGPLLKLEGGKTVSKREENKSWCWGAIGVEEDVENIADQEERGEQANIPRQRTEAEARARRAEQRSKREAEKKAQGTPSTSSWLDECSVRVGGAPSGGAESVEEMLARLDRESAEAPGAGWEPTDSIDVVLARLDHAEEVEKAEVTRQIFFELGESSAPAEGDADGAAGGVVVGRGAEYNFQAIRESGRRAIQRLADEDEALMPGSSVARDSTGRQAQLPGPGRMDMLTRRLQSLDQRGGLMALRDQDARGGPGAASAQATHRKVVKRPH